MKDAADENEVIECPSCKSKDAKRQMSSASISGFSPGISNYEPVSGSDGSCPQALARLRKQLITYTERLPHE